MGAKLVKAAFAYGQNLSDRDRCVLLYMAVTAKDDDEQPVFFGGRESLALAIGPPLPQEPRRDDRSPAADKVRKERTSRFKRLQQALRALADAGLIRRVSEGYLGHRSVYAMNLGLRAVDGDCGQEAKGERAITPLGERAITPEGERGIPSRGNRSFPSGGTRHSPQGVLRNQRGKGSGVDPADLSSHQAAAR